MAVKHKSGTCILSDCSRPARPGQRVCGGHLHLLVLQAELEKERGLQAGPLADLLNRFPELRRLIENIQTAVDRADPRKAHPVSAVSRVNGHNLTDGIVVLGDHHARPGYSASVKPDEGVLGAVIATVADARRRIDRILDPNEERRADPRPRCGRKECPGRWKRQPVDVKFCGFCGRGMLEEVAG